MGYKVDIYDQKDYEVWIAGVFYGDNPKVSKTLKQWSESEKADFTYNLAFFNMTGNGSDQYGSIRNRTLQYLKSKGKVIAYNSGQRGAGTTLIINSNNECDGWKVGIQNKVIPKNQGISSSGNRSRNANGMLIDGRYFHVQSTSLVTEMDLCNYMNKNFGVKLMLIQDSGGSVGCYDSAKKKLINAPEKEGTNGRAVASVLCVKRKNSGTVTPPTTPSTPAPTFKFTRALYYKTFFVMKGADVTYLQKSINKLIDDGKVKYKKISEDGSFGSDTKLAVKALQKYLGVNADGSFGPSSQKKFYAMVK